MALYGVMWRYVTEYDAIWSYVTSGGVIWRYLALCGGLLRYMRSVALCGAKRCYVALCSVM